ncbi:uncharacterized protein ACRADG_002251 [Cochliomyia hominivorax]
MIFNTRIIILLLAMIVLIHSAPLPNNTEQQKQHPSKTRIKRQIDLTLSAEHDDKEDETEIALEAIANLWRSSDGNTQIDGSAKVLHRSNSLQNGSGTDWRLGFRVLFT